MKAIPEDYAGELSSEGYKELIAELKKQKYPYLVVALRHAFGIKILIYTAYLNRMLNKKPSTKSRKCWRPPETARNPKIFLFRSLPTTFQNNVKSLLCLFPRANPTRRSASKFLMNTPLGQRCGEIYKRYEAYGLGYSTGFASKAIGVVLKVDDVEALQKDLPGDSLFTRHSHPWLEL